MFKSARSLITEYTTSISKGGCRLQSKQALPVGTRFVFEMYATNAEAPVEVEGEVIWCGPSSESGLHELGIRYLPSEEKRAALEKLLEEIFAEHRYEKARLHPRIPVNLVARDALSPEQRYLIRDLSRGGMGLRVPAETSLPADLQPQALASLAVHFAGEPPLEVGGEVVWIAYGRKGFTHTAIGVAFVGIGLQHQQAIDGLIQLRRPVDLTIIFGPRR